MKPNQFSLIFSFKIKEIKSHENILILKFFYSNSNYKKEENIISIIINKEKNLEFLINKDFKCNTNIKIEENIFYLICIICDAKNKNMALYINNEKILAKNISKEKIAQADYCYKYIFKANQYPNFTEEINVLLGDHNFYGILGEILLINIALDKQSVAHIFNSNKYYSNLLYSNEIKLNLFAK